MSKNGYKSTKQWPKGWRPQKFTFSTTFPVLVFYSVSLACSYFSPSTLSSTSDKKLRCLDPVEAFRRQWLRSLACWCLDGSLANIGSKVELWRDGVFLRISVLLWEFAVSHSLLVRRPIFQALQLPRITSKFDLELSKPSTVRPLNRWFR